MSNKKLQMTFDPNTIEHLGARMYTTLPTVLAELIANAYDAYAKNVTLTLNDKGTEKTITIEDNGIGMSFDEINEKFLKIGRNRRIRDNMNQSSLRNRKVIGKKGLGKLSFFGIAHEAEVTTRKEGKETVFIMSWEQIKQTKENKNYTPEIKRQDISSKQINKGTKIVLRKIQRKTSFDPEQLAINLSRIFIFDSDFTITIQHNTKKSIIISNDIKYKGLKKEFEWDAPFSKVFRNHYNKANQIKEN